MRQRETKKELDTQNRLLKKYQEAERLFNGKPNSPIARLYRERIETSEKKIEQLKMGQ